LVMPVMTAHPTQVSRKTRLLQEQHLARLLVDRIEQTGMTPWERARKGEALSEEITRMWQTAEDEEVGRSVADEREQILFYLLRVIYRVIPAFYDNLQRALQTYPGAAPWTPPRPLLRFGSWVGGDMDGNPLVGADTLRETFEHQRALIIARYADELVDLRSLLSQSASRVASSADLQATIGDYASQLPEVDAKIPARHRAMPYRVLLRFMRARLLAVLDGGAQAYRNPSEFIADLRIIIESLRANRGHHAGLREVERLLWRARTFGFHLVTVDLRQDALEHRHALAALLHDDTFVEARSDERTRRIVAALSGNVPPLDAEARSHLDARGPQNANAQAALRAIDVMTVIAEGQHRFGADAVGSFIVSMAQGPDDALAVLYLAKRAGLTDAEGHVPLDVTPLFETVNDLATAGQTMAALFSNPLYRAHLRARGDQQMVMLGYSDSSKGDGLASSRWALFVAQEALVAVFASAGIRLRIFHGRGGTVSRGGSKPRGGILAEPRGAVDRHLRVTEQGEMIDAKYGLRGTALRTLELMSGAVLERSLRLHEPEVPEGGREVMEIIASRSREVYRALVYEHKAFYSYFRHATPIDVIERLRIGSRPASRRAGQGVGDLRAIPWVFSWVQSRHLLTGWYGLGSGIRQAEEHLGQERVEALARRWPFFRNLLTDVEMVLAKTDLDIASLYVKLAGDAGEEIFPLIRHEFARTRDLVCTLKGVKTPLDDDPELQQTLALRKVYVDPLSALQVDLLRRWRAGDRQDKALQRALYATVRGIARGMQNVG
ncbi:MAG: phosphoenolpyruvate carboxylase, partial [Deltaproteobacteria bacterium]|nr:phosphoenolpyruvate carboxylase [Deltaproteobacteria bacterium]